MGAKI